MSKVQNVITSDNSLSERETSWGTWAICFNPEENHLLVSDGSHIEMRRCTDLSCEQRLQFALRGISCSGHGKQLKISGIGANNKPEIWSLVGEQLHCFDFDDSETGVLTSMNGDGDLLAATTRSSLYVWQIQNGEKIVKIKDPEMHLVTQVRFADDKHTVLALLSNRVCKAWPLSFGMQEHIQAERKHNLFRKLVNSTSKLVCLDPNLGTITSRHFPAMLREDILPLSMPSVDCFAVSTDGKCGALSQGNLIQVINLDSGMIREELSLPDGEEACALTFINSAKEIEFLVVGTRIKELSLGPGRIYVYSLPYNNELLNWPIICGIDGAPTCFAVDKSHIIWVGDDRGSVYRFRLVV